MKCLIFTALIFIIAGCSSTEPRELISIKTKKTHPELVQPTPFSQGLINSYDIFAFLKDHPDPDQVVSYLGLPDSVWVDDEWSAMIWYYFIDEFKDYNSIEINVKKFRVTGFEWD